MKLTYGSVCSGIEAASVAWHPFGWQPEWFAEVDKAACAVLAYRFPHVPNHGDMTTLAARVRAREIPAPDVLVGGTPCQAFSVAGLRGGLQDARGQLTLAFVLLADAIDEIRAEDGLEPVIIVWENVPGVLNHADNPFGCFLAGVAGESDALVAPGGRWSNAGAVFGPERTAGWRTLDAQFVGLAQRRKRVFVVASAREGFDPPAILLEFDGVRRDSAPSREAGEGFTHPTAPCLVSSGRGVERTGDTRGQDPVVAVHVGRRVGMSDLPHGQHLPLGLDSTEDMRMVRDGSVGVRPAAGIAFGGNNQSGPIDVATACNAHGGPHGRLDFESETFIVEPIAFTSKDYGGDATVDCSPTLRSMGHSDSHANGGGQVGVAYYAFQPRIARNGRGDMGDLVNALQAQSGETGKGDAAPCVAVLPFDTTQITSVANRSNPAYGDPCHPLAAGAHPPAIAIDLRNSALDDDGPTMTLAAGGIGEGRGMCINAIPHVFATGFRSSQSGVRINDTAGTLDANYGSRRHNGVLYPEMAVRRLMPVECERLQGFPDNWTHVPTKPVSRARQAAARADTTGAFTEIDGVMWAMAADGPRYKQCGNSMATNVMHWIGARIDAALTATVDEFDGLLAHNGGPALDDDFEALLA